MSVYTAEFGIQAEMPGNHFLLQHQIPAGSDMLID
jgi:hypothetical protein